MCTPHVHMSILFLVHKNYSTSTLAVTVWEDMAEYHNPASRSISISGLLLPQDGCRMETAATHKTHHSSLCPQSPQADKDQVRGEQRVWPRWTGWTEVLEVGAGWMSQWMWSTVSHFSARHLAWRRREQPSWRAVVDSHTPWSATTLCPPSLHSPASGPVKPAALDLGGYAGFLELSMVN